MASKKKQETWISHFEKEEARSPENVTFTDHNYFIDFDKHYKPKIELTPREDGETSDKTKKKAKKKKLPLDRRLKKKYLGLYKILLAYVIAKTIGLSFFADTKSLSLEKDFRGDFCGVGKHAQRHYFYFFRPVGSEQLSILCLSHCPK